MTVEAFYQLHPQLEQAMRHRSVVTLVVAGHGLVSGTITMLLPQQITLEGLPYNFSELEEIVFQTRAAAR